MTNVNDYRLGQEVIARETRTRGFGYDFPGWGHPDAASYLRPIPAGLTGRVIQVESHGMNPWTRYSVRFADGTWSSGLIDGRDFEWVTP